MMGAISGTGNDDPSESFNAEDEMRLRGDTNLK